MRLDGDDDEILLAGFAEAVGDRHAVRDDRLALALHPQTVAADRVPVLAILLDERDLLARERQAPAEHATDSSGAYDTDAHVDLYSKRFVRVPTPSIATSIVLPGFILPAPIDVPHA